MKNIYKNISSSKFKLFIVSLFFIFYSCNKESGNDCISNLYGIYSGSIYCYGENDPFNFNITSNTGDKINISFRLDDDDDDSLVSLVGVVNSSCNSVDISIQNVVYESEIFGIGGSFEVKSDKIVGYFNIKLEDGEINKCDYTLVKR